MSVNRWRLRHSVSALALMAMIAPATAQTVWTGAIDDDWFKAGNWMPAILPAGPTWVNSNTPGAVMNGGPAVALAGTTMIGRDAGTNGSLVIRNGASLASESARIAFFAGSAGAVTVDTGSWAIGTSLVVGSAATGTLTILNGGSVSTGTYLTIGDQETATGSVTVDGAGSTMTVGQALEVGWIGKGTLDIRSGGVVTSGEGRIASGEGSSGVVTIDGTGSAWSSTGTITLGNFGNGIVTVRNGGSISATGGIGIALEAQSTSALNIGAAAGDVAAAPGTVAVSNILFGAGDGRLVFNHTSTGYSFAPTLLGDGRIDQIAGTTIMGGDSGAFTGSTRVEGGQLIVNGSLTASNVTVSGGVLGGTGMLGNVGIHPGGTISPGHGSIGTLTVANFGQAPGSTYQVELASNGTGDRINVAGLTELIDAPALQIIRADGGPYALGTRYTVLTSAGGVTGTYALTGDTQITAFLGFSAAYDPNNVYIDVAQVRSFTAAAQTANQLGTAAGLGTLPVTGPLSTALLNLPNDAAAQQAFDQLSGEVHSSARSVLLSDSQFVRDAALGRLRTTSGNSAPAVAEACGASTSCAVLDEMTVWARGFGSWGHWNGDGNAATVWRNTGGLFVGADVPVMQRGRAGLLVGYSNSSIQAAERNSSVIVDNFHLGAYGGARWGDLALRAGFAYTWHTLSTVRAIAFQGFSDTVKGRYSGGTGQAFGELGYGLQAAGVAIEPFANVAYAGLRTDGFSETGGAAALTSGGSFDDATFTTLGARASTDFTIGSMQATAKGSAGWRHAFGDTTPGSSFAFAGGGAFTVLGVPIARDSAVIEAGVEVGLAPGVDFGVSYGGQFGAGASDQSARGTLSVRF